MKSSSLRIAIIASSILGISLLHYLTPLHLHYLHDIFQRFYYIPIILAALWFGFRGGLGCAIIVSIAYTPHILFQWGGHLSMEMEKYLEILLYNIVGSLTGLLAQREREQSLQLQKTAEGLEDSYRKLQEQSDRIIAVEDQLRHAEKLSSLGEMAAVLAHEIRNPLGSIRGTAEILKDDYPPGSKKHEFIEIQIKETERLNNVVEDFLKMARQQPFDMKSCSITEELETIVKLTENLAKARGIILLPEFRSSGKIMTRGDGEKLRQAFLNIINNGLQATLPGGTVSISTRLTDTDAEIIFKDSGSGINSSIINRIFEPFFTTKADGTGLGLAVSRKIIEGHGGSLKIESEPDLGTTVVVCLPSQQPDLPL
ncbi:MAG TPA: ATP-binding protein [Geobacteraceae bacterium]|nr:ATP-binding protein [Geobacteraceae bacterium]